MSWHHWCLNVESKSMSLRKSARNQGLSKTSAISPMISGESPCVSTRDALLPFFSGWMENWMNMSSNMAGFSKFSPLKRPGEKTHWQLPTKKSPKRWQNGSTCWATMLQTNVAKVADGQDYAPDIALKKMWKKWETGFGCVGTGPWDDNRPQLLILSIPTYWWPVFQPREKSDRLVFHGFHTDYVGFPAVHADGKVFIPHHVSQAKWPNRMWCTAPPKRVFGRHDMNPDI